MLEQVLRTWPKWNLSLSQLPVLRRELNGGETNRSFLCDAGGQKVVVRINNPNSVELGINRAHEAVILQQVSAAGIAPDVYYCNQEQGVLVTEYLEGKHWTTADFQNPDNQPKLFRLLDKIHAQSVELPEFDYYRHAEHYWQTLSRSADSVPEELRQLREKMLPELRRFQGQADKRVLCHHDIVPANIIESDGALKLLDWEYAGNGLADFDWAVIAAEGGVPQSRRYRDGLAMQVYQYIYRLWAQVR